MSDKTIRVGDLVIIIGAANPRMVHHIGKIGKVVGCSSVYPNNFFVDTAMENIHGAPCSWRYDRLKKIDPPALPESVTTDEKIHA